MEINEIAKKAHANAVRLGKIDNRTDEQKLKDVYREYLEAWKALSNRNFADWDLYRDMIGVGNEHESFRLSIKDTYEDELTDLLFVVLTLMEDCGMDIDRHIDAKSEYNRVREV